MTVMLEGGCRVSHMHDGAPLIEGTLRIWNQVGRKTGAQAISLRVMEFAPGLSPAIRNDDCDQILYVLERGHPARISERSERQALTLFLDGFPYDLGTDAGIYIRPNQIFAIDNRETDSITLISAQCPDPDRPSQFVNDTIAASSSSATDPLPIVRLADQRAQPTADRW